MEGFPPNLDPDVSTPLEGQLDKAKLGSKSVTIFTSNLPFGSYQAKKVSICVKKFNPGEKLAKPRVTGSENSDLLKKLSSNPPIHYITGGKRGVVCDVSGIDGGGMCGVFGMEKSMVSNGMVLTGSTYVAFLEQGT
ncbi:unnamed protein product [Lactuca saligna]|uniref:Uncharacterized protein n=1 Tax=Lactuca saligna TaxID=75948 RepID=A0AA36DVB1_LACSI|nr:unnamed protein product [Lactuca saligna]